MEEGQAGQSNQANTQLPPMKAAQNLQTILVRAWVSPTCLPCVTRAHHAAVLAVPSILQALPLRSCWISWLLSARAAWWPTAALCPGPAAMLGLVRKRPPMPRAGTVSAR